MESLHIIQKQILRELIFHPNANFSDLNISGLTNDHFSYHIRTLVKLGLVEKGEKGYRLTIAGKKLAGKMDTDNLTLEKQPKVTMLICPEKVVDGQIFYGIQTRLKEPYYGFKGFMSGKVKFGEKIFEAAERELMEEMGITGKFQFIYELHEMVYDKSGNMLEDKYFHAIKVKEVQGELVTDGDGCKNEWMTKEQFWASSPLYHNEVEIFDWFEKETKGFKEKVYFIDSF